MQIPLAMLLISIWEFQRGCRIMMQYVTPEELMENQFLKFVVRAPLDKVMQVIAHMRMSKIMAISAMVYYFGVYHTR